MHIIDCKSQRPQTCQDGPKCTQTHICSTLGGAIIRLFVSWFSGTSETNIPDSRSLPVTDYDLDLPRWTAARLVLTFMLFRLFSLLSYLDLDAAQTNDLVLTFACLFLLLASLWTQLSSFLKNNENCLTSFSLGVDPSTLQNLLTVLNDLLLAVNSKICCFGSFVPKCSLWHYWSLNFTEMSWAVCWH